MTHRRRRYHLWLPAMCAVSLAQGTRAQTAPEAQPQPMESPGTASPQADRQLSEQGQHAVARLHALTRARARYAAAGAEAATHAEARQFLEQQAANYRQANASLARFARNHGVDLRSPQIEQLAEQDRELWREEYRQLRGMRRREAAQHAVDTFIRRNEQAKEDLRTLRDEVRESEVRALIDDYVAALDQESERARGLLERIEQRHQRRHDQQPAPHGNAQDPPQSP